MRRRLSTLLLVAGYSTATLAGRRIVPAIKERDFSTFAKFEAGTACVVAGLLLRGRRIPALLNIGALLTAALAWRRASTGTDSSPRS